MERLTKRSECGLVSLKKKEGSSGLIEAEKALACLGDYEDAMEAAGLEKPADIAALQAELTALKGQIERGEVDRMLSIPPTTTNRDGTTRPTAIAVDFDGCICTNAWPEIGEANVPLIAFLIRHKAHGGELILWTCREGKELDAAVNWCCGERGLKFDALNENLPSWKAMFGNDTRKLGADYYIDDKAVCVKAAALKP